MPKLLVLLPDGVSTEYELSDEQLSIGRGTNNTIKIDDTKASRNHCAITKDTDGSYFIKDLDSRNGTKLNGTKIAMRVKLKVGDVIRIGKTKFAFEKFPENYKEDEDGPGDTVAEEAEKPKYVLEVVEGKSVGGIIELKDGVTTFGRKPSNDVTVDDDKASGNHCEIRKEAMGYILVDLDSTNGTKFRASGKSEYEKVTKVPLSVGSDFRIGATVYKYKNIGAPSPDDEVLAEVAGGKIEAADGKPSAAAGAAVAPGTHAPHTGKTVHVPRPATSPMAMAGLGIIVAIAVLSVVGFFLLHNGETGGPSQPGDNPDPGPSMFPQPVAVKNSNFQMPANADGQPVNWVIGDHGKQKLSQVTDPKEPPTSKNMVCEIDRSSAGSAQAVYELNSEHINEVKQGGAYQLKMRLRSTTDAEGAFGVKLQFFSSKNELVAEYPHLLTGSHDGWYQFTEKEFVVKAPDQPTYAQLQLMAAGNKGQVYFDDIQLKYMPAENPPRLPEDITNGLVTYKPRDFTGAFGVAINHVAALGQGRMAIIDRGGKVVSGPAYISLEDLAEKTPKVKIYNSALNEWTTYEISAAASGKGIQLSINPKDKPSDSQYHLALLVDLVDNYSACKVDSITADGDVKNLAGAEDGVAAGTKAQEILFSKDALSLTLAGSKANNLILAVSRLTNKQRTVTILCDNAVELFVAADSETLARSSAQLVDQIGANVHNKAWGAATKGCDDFHTRYGARFAALAAQVKGFEDQIDAAYSKDSKDASAMIPAGKVTSAVGKPIGEALKNYVRRWQDTPHQSDFEKLSIEMGTHIQDGPVVDANAVAAEFKQQEAMIDVCIEESKTDDVANKLAALLNNYRVAIKRNDASDAGKAAAEKLKGYDAVQTRLIDENNLFEAAQAFVTAGQYPQAVGFVKNHPTYKKYDAGAMVRLEAAMKRWDAGKP
ncbi:MAG TPA: FHA domain-containing protein [Planctomycetota bacterium]|nr:FHA domain-containing protein [Planctomycetota bacterium]